MAKTVIRNQPDYFVQVSICSLNSFLSLNPFEVVVGDDKMQKIDNVLANSIGSQFILFPEYTYSEVLREKYQTYSNENNCIIIAGSGLEAIGANFYAYSPVFTPNEEPIKVYKKHITPEESVRSNGRIIPYPSEVSREIEISLDGDFSFTISVFICLDFLQERKDFANIIFVPQFEHAPKYFINEGDKHSKGLRTFVLGANVADASQRSIGFASLNSMLITVLSEHGYRREHYKDADGALEDYHHSILYDFRGERLVTFKLNIGNPNTLPHNFTMVDDNCGRAITNISNIEL